MMSKGKASKKKQLIAMTFAVIACFLLTLPATPVASRGPFTSDNPVANTYCRDSFLNYTGPNGLRYMMDWCAGGYLYYADVDVCSTDRLSSAAVDSMPDAVKACEHGRQASGKLKDPGRDYCHSTFRDPNERQSCIVGYYKEYIIFNCQNSHWTSNQVSACEHGYSAGTGGLAEEYCDSLPELANTKNKELLSCMKGYVAGYVGLGSDWCKRAPSDAIGIDPSACQLGYTGAASSTTNPTNPNTPTSHNTCPDTLFFQGICDETQIGYGITGLIVMILNWALVGVGTVVTIMVVIGGGIYMTAAGSQERAKQGIKIIRNALLGLVLYLIMLSALNFLVPGGIFT